MAAMLRSTLAANLNWNNDNRIININIYSYSKYTQKYITLISPYQCERVVGYVNNEWIANKVT